MGKSTVEQAYITREALLKKNKGATESSGAALSAVSGKNIRKAETAEARIARNEQIAAQKNAARIASGAAAGAVALEKTRAAQAQRLDHTRRNEILQMINQGIYDPAFAPELGYADDVVKQAAAEKNAARVKIKAAKAAAEKARREYEDYVAQLNAPAAEQAAPAVQKAEKPKNTQEAQTLLNRAAAQANNNLTGSTLAMAKNKVLDALGAVQRVEERHTGTDQAAEAAKKQEIAAALRAVSERYDQILEQRIAQKERAGKELEAPEQRYRASAKRAVAQARQAVERAESAEAKSTALEQYGITLTGAYRAAVTAATSALAGASLKYEAGAALNENEIETLKSQKARIAEMLDAVEREAREMRFDLDGQDVLKGWREDLETIGAALDAALDYGADYAGNEDAYRFMALDRMYGATPLAELEELLKKRDFAQNERFRIENRIRALESKLNSTRVRSASAWRQQEEMREELKALRAQLARLQTGESDTKELENYIDRRKQEEAQAAMIEQGRALLRDAAGGTLFEKFQALMDVTGENVRRYSWDPGEEWRDKNDVNTVLEDIKAFGENAKAAQDHRRAIAYAYHADLADYVDQLFTPAELEAEVRKARAFFAKMSGDEKVKWGRNVGFEYAGGRSESFKGNYEDFPRDLMNFAAGEYGDFTEDEAKSVLAVWQAYGARAAFDTYAALREGVTTRRAQALQGWRRIAAGLVSGTANFFTQGDDMIANALNPAGGYARIAGTVFTKSHELNLIGIDNEALAGLYKLGYSVADMAPQVAIAAIPGVGAYAAGAYMYAKVFAQTYNESVAAGKRADEALVYGVIEASAEVAAEKLLGGIEGIASKAGLAAQIGKATEQIAASPRVQLLLRWAGNMGSEGFEEFVQEVCEPFFVKLASDLTTGEHSDLQAVDWAQAFESFAIGALTAGVIDGVAMIGDLRYSSADYEAARRALDDGSALSVIQNGRLVGSRLAEQLYRNIKAGRAVQEGEGLRAFATEQDIMSIQKTYKSKLARAGKAEIATKLDADATLAPKVRRALNNVFSKILTGQKISVKEAADLINNPTSAAIMSRILGQNVETMLPNELAAAARLAAFTGLDGKATRERLALFRDAFGELDAAAITRIARYSDFAATDRVNNVLYEKGVRERLGQKEKTASIEAEPLHAVRMAPVAVSPAGYAPQVEALGKLHPNYRSGAKTVIKPFFEEHRSAYQNMSVPALGINAKFSAKDLNESMNKQSEAGGSFTDLFYAVAHLPQILQSAVLIQSHEDQYIGTSREEKHLQNFHVLLGMYQRGNTVVPVKIEIKEKAGANEIYVTTALRGIDAKKIGSGVYTASAQEMSTDAAATRSNISISEIFKNVNPADKEFLKYVPDAFLNEEQIAAKLDKIRSDIYRIEEMHIDGKEYGAYYREMKRYVAEHQSGVDPQSDLQALELLLNALPAGMKYVVCDDLQTGAYPAYGVMAVNAADMNSAGMLAIGHETYNLLRRLDPARADFVRDFVLERAGSAEEIQEEIKIIRQQAAVDGRTFSEQDAREELAARLMPAVLMSGINVQKLAETNEPAANALRRAMEAVIRNADENTLRYSEKLNYREVADRIENDENFRISEPFVKLGENVPANLARILGIKGNNLIIKFSKLYAIIRKGGNIETKAAEVHYHGMGSEFAKNITRYLNDPEVVVQRGDGRYNIFFKYGKGDDLAIVSMELNQKKKVGAHGTYDLIVTAFNIRTSYLNNAIENKNNVVIFEKEKTTDRKLETHARINVMGAINDSSFNNSISDSAENVNSNFYQTTFSDLTGSDLYDRLYDAIEWERQRESGIAYRGIIQSEADIEPVETEETDGGALERYNDLDEAARGRYLAQRSAEIEAYLNERDRVLQEMAGEHETGRDKITTGKERDRRGMRERMKESIDWARRKLLDSGTAIAQIGKQIRDPHLYAYYNMARASSNVAEYMITTAQTDVNGRKVGESLYSIFAPILERGETYYTEWQLYMYHMHNVDRMSRMQNAAVETEQTRLEFLEVKERYPELKKFSDKVIEQIAQDPEHLLNEFAREYTDARKAWERMQEIQNKPVFGYEVSADDSRLLAADMEERHPEFKEYAEKVYSYNRKMMDYRVQSGLIDRETADRFEEIYPHYVPTGRVQAGDPIYRQENRNLTQVGRTIRKAVGGNEALASLYHQMEDQTRRTVREGSKNRFGARLLNAWLRQSNGIEGIREVQETADRIREMGLYEGTLENDTEILQKEKYKNVFSVYRDGVKWEMDVTPHLYEAVDVLSPKEEKSTGVQNFGKMTVNLFKKLVTGVNPFFIVKNFSRDFQDALIFSKDTSAWLKNYPRAWVEMKRGGELWQQYRALGGTFASFFKESAVEPKSKAGKVVKKITHNKAIDWIEAANELVEQAPRFAEFLATVERLGTSQEALMQAMANAADITVNFGRSGTTGNMLNKYWIPFFNPGVQGFSKAIRLFTETKGARPWLAVVMKAAALGFAPALVNALFHGAWGDDDEWDLIRQRDKDNYYLWRIQKGKWIKIPKGRMLAALGIPMNRVIAMCGGERPGWAEIWETGAEMVEQVAPANPITNNLLGPLVLTAMGKTWYGSDIESRRMQQYAPGKRYDTHTDAISKWLGSITNISPKKINYVLDAYTGVMGDLVLPMLTPAAELNIFKANFTIDTDYSNRLSGDFYKRLDTLKYAQNEVDATEKDRVLYRFWNRCASGIGEINAAIRQIEEDASLSNDEKTALVREQYRARAALILSAEERFDEYEQSVDYWRENTENKRENESTEDYIYRMANFDVFGAEYALKAYGKSTYERAQAYNEEEGIAYETFYQFYFDPVADHEKGLALVSGGMNEESALQIARSLGALEPEQGSESVTWIQKMKAITAANVPQSDIKQALLHFGSDTEKKRITICYAHGVKMETYISVKEQLAKLNGTSGAKIQAAIEYAGKNLSKEQKAILWQILSSSTSAKNNPYSVAVGNAILGEKNH